VTSESQYKEQVLEAFCSSLHKPHFYFLGTTWCEASLLTHVRLLTLGSHGQGRLNALYGELRGVHGTIEEHLRTQCLMPSCIVTEITSCFVEIGYKLGLLKELKGQQSKSVDKAIKPSFFRRPWSLDEILLEFGNPLFECHGGNVISLCYGEQVASWTFFDIQRCDFQNTKILPQPRLRNIRWKGNKVRLCVETVP
jgi:hypothetical protein